MPGPVIDHISNRIDITVTPTFYTFTTTITYRSQPIWILLTPSSLPDESEIYYDGITLAVGDFSGSPPPVYEGPDSSFINWEDKTFENPVRNASAENGWIKVRAWADKRIIRPGLLSLALGSALDWNSYGDYFDRAFNNLFTTFWGKFGWNKVGLAGTYTYPFFMAITILGIMGSCMALYRSKFQIDWAATFILIAYSLGIWIPAILRGFDHALSTIFIPSARYALPAIIPVAMLLNIGWLEIAKYFEKFQNRYYYIIIAMIWIFFAGTEILGIFSIVRYFY